MLNVYVSLFVKKGEKPNKKDAKVTAIHRKVMMIIVFFMSIGPQILVEED